MYPVLSVLRRAAISYVYVRQDMLVEAGGVLHIRLETPTNRLVPEKAAWDTEVTQLIPMSELVVTSKSSESAAVSMAKKENELAESIRAEEAVYTLILGPEQEDEVDGVVVRRCRYAVVRGVYRASGKVGLEPVKAKDVKRSVYTRTRVPAVRLD